VSKERILIESGFELLNVFGNYQRMSPVDPWKDGGHRFAGLLKALDEQKHLGRVPVLCPHFPVVGVEQHVFELPDTK
jgi:hypothetical protein